jgi:hypothetical protein
MSADAATKIDIAPLTIVVSEALDPRVRRKLEAEQQADVKTYKELTRSLETQEDLNKIRQEVEDQGDEADPFKTPEPTESEPAEAEAQPQQPTPAENPTPAAEQTAEPATTPATTEVPADTAAPAETPAATGQDQGADEDLSSAFEGFGVNLPRNLLRKIVKDYIKMESSDIDSIGELEHIKSFVYIDLSQNKVDGDTLESVQTLRDPENTIVVINEESIPDADTTIRARRIAEQLSNRGVKIFYDLEEATNYLNELYDIVSGRKKDA